MSETNLASITTSLAKEIAPDKEMGASVRAPFDAAGHPTDASMSVAIAEGGSAGHGGKAPEPPDPDRLKEIRDEIRMAPAATGDTISVSDAGPHE